MSEQYSYTDVDGDILTASKSGIAVERPRKEMTLSAYLPKSPAELQALTEAIHGRKIAAIVYEDELPEVTESDAYLHANGLNYGDRSPAWRKETLAEARKEFVAQLALARHIEARDAAAKEQEAEREREVEALAEELGPAGTFGPGVRMATARRAYELGARVDGAQSEGAA